MIETIEKTINGSLISVTQLPARRALRLKAKLIKNFGGVFAQFLVSGVDPTNHGDLTRAIETLARTIDENTFENLITEILTGVRMDGIELTPPTIDLVFAGNLAQLYQIVWFVLEVNYANFFLMMGIGNQSETGTPEKTDSPKIYRRTYDKS